MMVFIEVLLMSIILDIIHAFRTKATADSSKFWASSSAFLNGLLFFYSLTYLLGGNNMWVVIIAFSLGQAAGTLIGIDIYDKYKKKK